MGFFSGSIHPENSMIVFRGSVTRPPEEPGGLHAVFPGRLVDNVLKMTVETGDGCKAYHFRDGENGLLVPRRRLQAFMIRVLFR